MPKNFWALCLWRATGKLRHFQSPGNGDEDGDLIDDVDDNCLNSYNPTQGDHDGDGTGDACDPVP